MEAPVLYETVVGAKVTIMQADPDWLKNVWMAFPTSLSWVTFHQVRTEYGLTIELCIYLKVQNVPTH